MTNPDLIRWLTLCFALCSGVSCQTTTDRYELDLPGEVPGRLGAEFSRLGASSLEDTAHVPAPGARERSGVLPDPLFSRLAPLGERRFYTNRVHASLAPRYVQRDSIDLATSGRLEHRTLARRPRGLYVSERMYVTASERKFEIPDSTGGDSYIDANPSDGLGSFGSEVMNPRWIGWGVGYHVRPNLRVEAEVGRDREWVIDSWGIDLGRGRGLFFGFEVFVGF